jgi:hypothetical protein
VLNAVTGFIQYLLGSYPLFTGVVATHVAQRLLLPLAVLVALWLWPQVGGRFRSKFDEWGSGLRILSGGLVAFTVAVIVGSAMLTWPRPRVGPGRAPVEAQSTRPPITVLPLPKGRRGIGCRPRWSLPGSSRARRGNVTRWGRTVGAVVLQAGARTAGVTRSERVQHGDAASAAPVRAVRTVVLRS